MKPHRDTSRLSATQRKHNRVLSKTRVPVENAFGLCKGRWRMLQFIDVYSINKSIHLTRAYCALHNFCLLHLDDTQNFHVATEPDDSEPPIFVLDEEDAGSEKGDQICAALN